MKILVTGTAGFIGMHTVIALLQRGHTVVGLDNINDYYDTTLKRDRLAHTGIAATTAGEPVQSQRYEGYRFVQLDLTDREGMERLFRQEGFDAVINLAGQAGVRYSIENPFAYAQSNLVGFLTLLECCRHHPVKHLVYASSSSVYGLNEKVPYAEADKADAPVSLYAATKKSNELMAHAYSKLYGIPTTGLRFFTVYGPWGRPDMAPCLFLKAILRGEPIRVFNHGHMRRDFTYVDDIVRGVTAITERPATGEVPFRLYNIGNSAPVDLLDFIHVIEHISGRKAQMQMMEMQPGDVVTTYADTTLLEHDFGYKPSTSIEEGIRRYYEWYVAYEKEKDSRSANIQ